jgi:hypothetical protein
MPSGETELPPEDSPPRRGGAGVRLMRPLRTPAPVGPPHFVRRTPCPAERHGLPPGGSPTETRGAEVRLDAAPPRPGASGSPAFLVEGPHVQRSVAAFRRAVRRPRRGGAEVRLVRPFRAGARGSAAFWSKDPMSSGETELSLEDSPPRGEGAEVRLMRPLHPQGVQSLVGGQACRRWVRRIRSMDPMPCDAMRRLAPSGRADPYPRAGHRADS